MHRDVYRTLFVIIVWSMSSLALRDQNPFLPDGVEDSGWPAVRGRFHNGQSPEVRLADQWPEAGPPVLWVKELGQGYSAFVAQGRRVFTQTQSLAGQYVVCLEADTGRTIWEHRYDLPYDPVGVYPGPRSTPTLADDKLVFTSPSGLVCCLNANTGDVVWSVNVNQKYHGAGCEFGYACSPTIVGKQVLLAVGGPGASIVSLHLDDGRELWKSGDDPASYTPLLPIKHAGRDCVVGLLQNSLVVCDLHSGRQLARIKLSEHYDEHSAWPIYREPYLWFAAPFRAGATLLRMPKFEDGSEVVSLDRVWHHSDLSNDVLSSVLVDGHVYGFDIIDVQSKTQRPSRGYFRCQDFETGKIKWSIGSQRAKRDPFEEPFNEPYVGQSGIVVADGKLLMLNEIGELILARVNSERYEELSRVSVLGGELVWTPPILHRGRLYMRNHSRAVCVYVGDLDLFDDRPTTTLRVSDVPQSNYVDWAGAILSIEPEYAFDVPSKEWLWQWFWITELMLAVGHLAGWLTRWLVRSPASIDSRQHWGTGASRTVTFVLACLGTTYLSRWTEQFLFTWPLALFVAFEIVVAQSRSRTQLVTRSQRRQERLAIVFLLLTSATYFLICRRLSLVFEWVFLAGPPAAIPFLVLSAKWQHRLGKLAPLTRYCWQALGYAALFGASVALLSLKY